MDPQAVNLGFELGKPVKLRFARPPVVLVEPVGANLFGVGERQSLRPVIHAFALRPARGTQAALQVVELFVAGGNLEGDNLTTHGCCPPNWFGGQAGSVSEPLSQVKQLVPTTRAPPAGIPN